MLFRKRVHHLTALTDSPRIDIRVALFGAGDQLGLDCGIVLKIKLAADKLLDVRTNIAPAALSHTGVKFI